MATFDRWAALFKFDNLDKRAQTHLKNVYASLAIAMLAASAGAYIHLVGIMQFGMISIIGMMGLMMWLKATPHSKENQSKRMGMLAGVGLFTGMSLGPLLDRVIQIDPSIIPTAFLATCVIFACFSISALLNTHRQYLYLGGLLMSCMSLLCMATIVNWFIGSRFLFQVNIYLGLLVMVGFVMYDTQLILERCRLGDDDFVWHSVDLFLDFINIFQRLLIILSDNNKKKSKK